jgi:hypothetical protein
MEELIAPPISIMKERIRQLIISRLNTTGLSILDYLIIYIYYKTQKDIKISLSGNDFNRNLNFLNNTEQIVKQEFEINLLSDKYGQPLLYL